MPSVFDAAALILRLASPLTPTRLHKLLYYCQGHHLAWDGVPLFPEELEAWANGPVCHPLWVLHQRLDKVESGRLPGDPNELNLDQTETVSAVLEAYGHLDGHQLSIMTQQERPWLVARGSAPPGQRHHLPIDLDVMRQFFSELIAGDESPSTLGPGQVSP
ncbi:MAG: DUF4065 domain-containing protein [Micrococcales bacterium]|nr:DUF4065 domain-containing protein [Micrococcales bacterium]